MADRPPGGSAAGSRTIALVVTYQSATVIAECLRSLPAAFDGAGPWRAVVIDNASTDGTPDVVAAESPWATVLSLTDNRGYAAAINAGVALAEPDEAVLVLNPDVRLEPGAVASLRELLAQPGVGIAVPRLVGPDGRTQHSLRRDPTVARTLGAALLGGRRAGRFPALGETETRARAYELEGDADWATGAALLISPACRAAVGAWDESFFLYCEEVDYALRSREAGFRLRYTPEAVVMHQGGELTSSPWLWALGTANRVTLFRRRHGRLESEAFRVALGLNEVLRAVPGVRNRATHGAALTALVHPPARTLPVPATDATAGWICFSGQDWWCHNQAHSDFQLMLRVARDQPVLMVNSIGLRVPMPGKTTNPGRRVLRKALSVARLMRRPVPGLPNFNVLTPLSVPLSSKPAWRAANAALVRAQIRLACRRLGLHRPTVMVTLPTAWDVVKRLDHGALVYNRSDKHSAFSEADGEAVWALETELLRRADIVEYVSGQLMEEERSLTGDRARFLDHGVDLERFRARPEADQPADLRAIPRPRVGYFGGLNGYQIDFALLERVARELPDVQLVLVGHADRPLGELADLPNVHHLGRRTHHEIPGYGSGFDVAIMPWLDNEWIRYANPIKLKEYLALGLPIVTTPLAEAEPYRDLLTIAADGDAFLAGIRAVLVGDGPAGAEARRAAVADASWDRRAADLVGHLAPRPSMVVGESSLDLHASPFAGVGRGSPSDLEVSA
jgi:GT2 family glycosyltransferase/glycosyltransferase involved in cell wall biosynthesis